jgi:hypothetical protein
MVCISGGLPAKPAMDEMLMMRPLPLGIMDKLATSCDKIK